MTTYRYTPLEFAQKSIRLLRIEKRNRSCSIQCQLIETVLGSDEGIPYRALSYTWDDLDLDLDLNHDSPLPPLFIDKFEVTIKKNLHTALQHIRREDQDVYLWVDALCINQSDNEERSNQVSQMGDIYRAAEEVIVWLGRSVSGVALLFHLISTIDKQAAELYQAGDGRGWDVLCSQQQRSLSDASELLDVLKGLLQRRWFERIWIVQEVALAKVATIRCGIYTCPARTFAWIPSLIGLEVDEQRQAVLDTMPRFRKVTWWSSERCLNFLLQKFKDSNCREDRDKIYALLSISDDAYDPKCFYPSYTISDEEVFRDTASFLVFGNVFGRRVYSLPKISLSQLSQPISQLVKYILNWTLDYTNNEHERRDMKETAIALIDRINKGKLNTQDLLLSLAEDRGQLRELHYLLAHGDVQVGVHFRDESDSEFDSEFDSELYELGSDLVPGENALTVSSNDYKALTLHLYFASRHEVTGERDRFEPQYFRLPYKQREDMTAVIQELKITDAPKDDFLRAYAWKGDTSGVRELLDDDVDVNAADKNGCTALHLALYRCNLETAQLLRDSGADIEQRDVYGNTASFYATRGSAMKKRKLVIWRQGYFSQAEEFEAARSWSASSPSSRRRY